MQYIYSQRCLNKIKVVNNNCTTNKIHINSLSKTLEILFHLNFMQSLICLILNSSVIIAISFLIIIKICLVVVSLWPTFLNVEAKEMFGDLPYNVNGSYWFGLISGKIIFGKFFKIFSDLPLVKSKVCKVDPLKRSTLGLQFPF